VSEGKLSPDKNPGACGMVYGAHTALISVHDEQQLEWFFSRGQTAFERSTSGGMFERGYLYSQARAYRPERAPVLGKYGQLIGWQAVLDARPTAETRNIGGYLPDAAAMNTYAEVSAKLKRLERLSAVSALVVELIYGDIGQRWATQDGLDQPFGRTGALFHITHKGRQLIVAARKHAAAVSSTSLNDEEQIEVIVKVQRAQPRPERGQALAYCAAQAKQLEQQARVAWHAVAGGRLAA
jgi:hypothetical protein